MNKFYRGIIFLFFCVIGISAYSQSAKRIQKTVDKRQAQLEKQEKEKIEKAEKEAEAKKKRHFELQTKKVQKIMKKTKKKSKKYNDKKKQFFLKRWFKKR